MLKGGSLLSPFDYLRIDFLFQKVYPGGCRNVMEVHGKNRYQIVVLFLSAVIHKLRPKFDENNELVTYQIPDNFKLSLGWGGYNQENKYKGAPFGQSFACCIMNGGSIFVKSEFSNISDGFGPGEMLNFKRLSSTGQKSKIIFIIKMSSFWTKENLICLDLTK
jgi:hypothetical protein